MKLDRIFTSNMVFAAEKPIRVYGTGEGEVTVRFAGQCVSTKSEGDNWTVELPAMQYGGPYELAVEFSDRTETLENVFVGEVYLFAGQSNMQFKMWESSTPIGEDNANLRLFSPDRIEKTDKFTADDGWRICTKEDTPHWTAIGYHTATEIAKKGIAVGVVACYQGASTIESWVPKGALDKIGGLSTEEKHPDHTYSEYSAWQGEGTLYEYAFLQVVPFSFSGVVWYQGESDTSKAEGEVYFEELSEMIKIWRRDLKNETLPFVIVQLADYVWGDPIGWKLIQEAQTRAGKDIPFVKTVISKDVCEPDNIHPPTKDKLAKRIAKALT